MIAGYDHFQVTRNKNTRKDNIFERGNNTNKFVENLTKSEKLMNGIALWCSFYRANPHRFAEEYLGIKLKLFQVFLLYMMNYSHYFMYLAARSQGKSWLISIYCVIRAILYPGTKIILASGTKSQARNIIAEKIVELHRNSPNLQREISVLRPATNDPYVEFHNGSFIRVVASNDNARSARGNLLIADEFRMIDLSVINKVLRRFLGAPRQPKYLNKPEYKHLKERNKEIYISSAWYKSHWSFSKFKSYIKAMIEEKRYFVCGLPYQLSIAEGLLMEEQVLDEMQEEDFDSISWMMEMECLFFGESEKAFYKLDDIHKCRTLKKPFLPLNNLEFTKNKRKKKSFNDARQAGEIRLIGVDVALMPGNQNDNTVFTCMRLLPSRDGYIRYVPYIESLNGQHSETQAIRLKQLYHDFEADYVIMDTQGNGLGLYDACVKILYDEERDIEYPAWCAMNNEEMKNRALDENAIPVIYSLKITKQETNHEVAMSLKSDLEKRKIRLLINDIEAKDYLIDKYDYLDRSTQEQVEMLKPYIQTSVLVNEMVNLEYEIKNGYVKLKEIGSNRKDRFSSLAYCNYYARLLEKELKEEEKEVNIDNYLLFN